MSKPPSSTTSKHEQAAHAVRLAQIGDLEGAAAAFEAAIALDRRNLDLAFNLAIVEEQLGGIDRAAELLSTVLAQKPAYPNAAARLSRLLARFQLEDRRVLNVVGLKAALAADGIAHQPLVDATCGWLVEVEPDISAAIADLEGGQIDECEIGQRFFTSSTGAWWRLEVLQLCLRRGIIKHAALERLLTGARSTLLLACATQRFEDRSLTDFALALIVQGWNNDHAWAETPEETAALAALAIDRAGLITGDREAARRYLCAALYRPLETLMSPPLTSTEAQRLKPRSLRDTIAPQIEATARQRAAGAGIPALKPLSDATSLKVAGQYEAAPYPRWHSLHLSEPGALKRSLQARFPDGALSWLDAPFEVLIAGCGTGQQALQSATAYGSGARLLAMDLSRASLGYARDMATRLGVANVEFVQGDILDAALLARTFDIIECVGVLHHMADWRAGWQALLPRLKPNGMMYIGLYSAVSRRNLATLRLETGYPGPGCSDAAARAYRRDLLLRAPSQPGGELKLSRDFYALNAFRDLALHESEAHVTLDEIADFLDRNGLAFRGFTVEPQVVRAFNAAIPGSGTPGTLADWATFEHAEPATFDAMYRFWVTRRN